MRYHAMKQKEQPKIKIQDDYMK